MASSQNVALILEMAQILAVSWRTTLDDLWVVCAERRSSKVKLDSETAQDVTMALAAVLVNHVQRVVNRIAQRQDGCLSHVKFHKFVLMLQRNPVLHSRIRFRDADRIFKACVGECGQRAVTGVVQYDSSVENIETVCCSKSYSSDILRFPKFLVLLFKLATTCNISPSLLFATVASHATSDAEMGFWQSAASDALCDGYIASFVV